MVKAYIMCVLWNGYYDYYKTHDSHLGLYNELDAQTMGPASGIYHIFLNVAVYSGLISFLLAVAYLAINARESRNGGKGLAEAKSWILRVFLISMIIFGLSGALTILQSIGLDS